MGLAPLTFNEFREQLEVVIEQMHSLFADPDQLLRGRELGATRGVVRAHGSTGAFVSQWTIRKDDLSVVSR